MRVLYNRASEIPKKTNHDRCCIYPAIAQDPLACLTSRGSWPQVCRSYIKMAPYTWPQSGIHWPAWPAWDPGHRHTVIHFRLNWWLIWHLPHRGCKRDTCWNCAIKEISECYIWQYMNCLSGAEREIIQSRLKPTIFCITVQCCTTAPYFLIWTFNQICLMADDFRMRKVYSYYIRLVKVKS